MKRFSDMEIIKAELRKIAQTLSLWSPSGRDLVAWPAIIAFGVFLAWEQSAFNSGLNVLSCFAFHEIGHSVADWVTGKLAIPTFFMSVRYDVPGFGFFMTGMFVVSLLWARTRSFLFLQGLFFILFLATLPGNLLLNEIVKEQWTLMAGLGGEAVLGAAALLAFFAQFPRRCNWWFNRWLLAGLGAFSLSSLTFKFSKARSDETALPYGAALDFDKWFGGESGGDIDRLTRDFGWSAQQLTGFYWTLCLLTWLTLAAAWLALCLYYALQKSSSERK